MANAAIVVTNLALTGTWTASAAETDMPVTKLQNPHVGKKWRLNGTSGWALLDLGIDQSFDTVTMHGIHENISSIRLRLSTSAGGPTSGALHDVTYTSADEEFKPSGVAGMNQLIVPRAAVSGRYARFDFVSSTIIEAGIGCAGLREAFTYNFVPGGGVTWTDRSRREKSAGGQTLIFLDKKFRTCAVNFDWVPKAQRNGLWKTLGSVNGNSIPVLLILDTESEDLPFDSVYGLVTNQIGTAFTGIADIYTAPLSVEERL